LTLPGQLLLVETWPFFFSGDTVLLQQSLSRKKESSRKE